MHPYRQLKLRIDGYDAWTVTLSETSGWSPDTPSKVKLYLNGNGFGLQIQMDVVRRFRNIFLLHLHHSYLRNFVQPCSVTLDFFVFLFNSPRKKKNTEVMDRKDNRIERDRGG